MAFQKEGNLENKQHINLSEYAISIVENDMFVFHMKSRSSFLNLIFTHFKAKANSSVSVHIKEMELKYSTYLSNNHYAQENLYPFLSFQEELLLSGLEQYEKGMGFKFRINKKNMDYLTNPCSPCHEEKYYKSIGAYWKAIIEEYCLLPFSQREEICFQSIISMIKRGIQQKIQLHFIMGDNQSYYVKPYKIMRDSLDMYQYIIGYSISSDDNSGNYHLASFRISNLKKITLLEQNSFLLSNEEFTFLTKEIEQKRIPFLLNDLCKIRIQFTQKGFGMYQKILHLRPVYTEKLQDNEYLFYCTKMQAEFYFFKFGEEIKIVEPEDLANKFQQKYKNAYTNYE